MLSFYQNHRILSEKNVLFTTNMHVTGHKKGGYKEIKRDITDQTESSPST